MAQLFFGVGSGRVASMSLANALNAEADCLCLHEGKIREFEESGEQVLPFLTLQNRRAFEYPNEAMTLFGDARTRMPDVARSRDLAFFGDVAYNYAPFVSSILRAFPSAKIIYQFRDCLGFLASCTTETGTDETPVGWPPKEKPLSKVERYIALGRLQPKRGTQAAVDWSSWSHTAKNIWLWAETNRIIIEALTQEPARQVYGMRFEKFKDDPRAEYTAVREFLGLPGPPPEESLQRLTARPINYRKSANRLLTYEQLSACERQVWATFAEPVRQQLKYHQLEQP